MITESVKVFLREKLKRFPYEIQFLDWENNSYSVGLKKKHWFNAPLKVHIKNKKAGKKILGLDALGFLECFLRGDVDMEGNLYILPYIQDHTTFELNFLRKIPMLILNKSFQTISRTRENVNSHYDIPQEAIELYLDKVYLAYSCAIFEKPYEYNKKELLAIGQGKSDRFDSLEKAQWRKFKDAVDFLNPLKGETMLDVGCGYGGQLKVALESYPFGKVVGWTHSKNQYDIGKKALLKFDKSKWELHHGDYRQEKRIFDHVTSTGMACHVGPRGLVPYVKNIRKRIKKGGRYLHHVLMTPHLPYYLDFSVGVAFNKKYVWPGFHWFTLGQHIKALEQNGFQVVRAVNLSQHYSKTIACWYERMMKNKDEFVRYAGEKTFRAWQVYLACSSETLVRKRGHVYRVYCEAV